MAVSNTTTTNPDNNRRFALIVANSDYKEDPDLSKLIAPAQDADALYFVLKNPDIGGFDEVKIIKNQPSYEISKEIQTFLNERRPNDMLLLYFSCHGIKNEDGQLYFAATNTRRTILDSTAISADFINRVMFKSRSKRQVLVLDCCYSGAFTRGFIPRSDKTIHTNEYFDQGKGRVVLTASGAMQYSFEENTLKAEVENPGSIFTRTVVEGMKTGKADLNQDGMISYNELYEYTHDRVIDITPSQIPEISSVGVAGDLFIAKNPFKSKEHANKLVQEALDYLTKREYLTAVEYSDKAIKLKPDIALAYNIRGQAFFGLKQYQNALVSYDKALELQPNSIEVINNKGILYTEIGDHNKAIECFDQSTDINPSDAGIWNYKGLSSHTLGKYEDAVASYDKAIILKHTFVDAINNRESSKIQINKKRQLQELQRQQEPKIGTGTIPTPDIPTHEKIRNVPQSSSEKIIKNDFTAINLNAEARTPAETSSQTVQPKSAAPISPSYISNTMEKDVHYDVPRIKGPVPSINTSDVYGTPEDDRYIETRPQEIKKTKSSKLKILIPIIAVVIGIAIAVIIFQPSPPSTSSIVDQPAAGNATAAPSDNATAGGNMTAAPAGSSNFTASGGNMTITNPPPCNARVGVAGSLC